MLYADVHRQRLKLEKSHIAADTIDYLEMEFRFTDDWDGFEKWAHFAHYDRVYDIRLTEDRIRKEDHLNPDAGRWTVYLHGNRFENGEVVERITTNTETMQVVSTGVLKGSPFPERPASVTEQILARLAEAEKKGGSLNPVEKTDVMTLAVGRDEAGQLWCDPITTGHGLASVAFGARYNFATGESQEMVEFVRDDGKKLELPLDELYRFMGIADVTVSGSPPSAADSGKKKDIWFDSGTQTLYICTRAKTWIPVIGLPAYTAADEGKVLQIVNGKPMWTAGG